MGKVHHLIHERGTQHPNNLIECSSCHMFICKIPFIKPRSKSTVPLPKGGFLCQDPIFSEWHPVLKVIWDTGIYYIYGTLRWSFKNETTHLGWMNSMKQFGILSRNPGAVRTSRRITAETFQRCSMSCRFEKLCRYRTIIRYGLIN